MNKLIELGKASAVTKEFHGAPVDGLIPSGDQV
jgi:hypothetical protein